MKIYFKAAVLAIISNIVLLVVFSQLKIHYLLFSFIPLTFLVVFILTKFLSNLAIVFLILIFIFGNFFHYGLQNNHGYTMAEGWTMAKARLAAQQIKNDVSGQKYNITMLVDGESQGWPVRYFLNRTVNKPEEVEKYGRDLERLYLVAPQNVDLQKISLWELDSFRPFAITKTFSLGGSYQLLRIEKTP